LSVGARPFDLAQANRIPLDGVGTEVLGEPCMQQ
jgi:hypothetical protein